MDFRNSAEKTRDRTAIESRGLKTLHRSPSLDLLYFLFSSLETSSCITK